MELDIAREQLRQAQQTGPSTTRKSDLAKQIEQLKKERDAAVEDAAKSKKSLQNGNANFTRLFNEAKKERDTAKQSLKTGNANFTKRFSEVQEQLNHVRQQLKQANERLNKGRQMYNETDNELEAVKAELESTEAYWSEKVEDLQHQLAARDKELAGLKKKGRRMDSGWNKYGETPY
ncbi:hypothetical protein B0T21DRAFT_357516 [Apiosordaria backusii]|uniref:Uncharacterized protein n=1 Tax=Apiosordaria backusii TaxID=314023 RepID=A0AA40ERR5_9PEZI|nr:hypothetical protein B0T21DRAFT_357516 [Apiosordaria backusii]